MCGRFTQVQSWAEVAELYGLTGTLQNLEPRYNVAPTQRISVVLPGDDGRHLVRARRGLIPIWWKKPLKDLPATFNARAESVAEKPMFRSAHKARRCIIPASGFYEWTGPKGAKQPWYITAVDGKPLSFAGLWERYRDPESGEEDVSATIVVCGANVFMSTIHNRMPVMLDPVDFNAWLGLDPAAAGALLRAARKDA